MKTYHNQKWNFSLDYPEDWEVVRENEPEGGWELVVGVAGKPSLSGRPWVTVHIAQHPVLDFFPGNVPVGRAAGRSGESVGLPRTVDEYNQLCKQTLKNELPGVQFISEAKGILAGMASSTLISSYRSKTGVMRETQVNLFGTAVTYRLLCEAPEEQSEAVERYFETVVVAFTPSVGESTTSAETVSFSGSNIILVETGLCPTCGRNFGSITGQEFGPTTIRCKKCGSVLDAHAQWKDWDALPKGTKVRLIFIYVGLPIIGFFFILGLIGNFILYLQGVELFLALGFVFVVLWVIVVFVIVPFIRRVSESKKLLKENKIPEW